jgi:hypothetical protein
MKKRKEKKRYVSINIRRHVGIFNFNSIVSAKWTLGVWLLRCHSNRDVETSAVLETQQPNQSEQVQRISVLLKRSKEEKNPKWGKTNSILRHFQTNEYNFLDSLQSMFNMT